MSSETDGRRYVRAARLVTATGAGNADRFPDATLMPGIVDRRTYEQMSLDPDEMMALPLADIKRIADVNAVYKAGRLVAPAPANSLLPR